MTAAPDRHWPELDGWRGAAVIGVLAYHLGWLGGGFLGVDLFFTLSGFLITGLLVREHERNGRIALGDFWARRARRLLPAVAVLIVVVLAWLARWGTASEQALARADARWALPYLANWHLIADSRDYWASTSEASVFNHLWSLAIEEQFYVVWPLIVVVLLGRAHRVRRLTLGTTLLAMCSLAAMVMLGARGEVARVYFGTDTRAVALLLGAVAALPGPRRAAAALVARHGASAGWLLAAATTALAVLWWWGGSWLEFLLHGGLAVHAAIATVAIAVTVALDGAAARHPLRRLMSSRALVVAGTRSYGLYLWHWPVIVLVEDRFTSWSPPARDLLAIAISLMFTEVSYRLLEQPIRRRSGWAARRRADTATTAVSALAVIAVVVAPSGKGDIARFDPASLAVPAATGAPLAPDPTTTVAAAPTLTAPTPDTPEPADTTITDTTVSDTTISDTTVTGSVAATAPSAARRVVERVVWIGDSVAADLGPALVARFDAAGVALYDGGLAGARLVPSAGIDTAALYDQMLRDHPADVVVVQLMQWDSPFSADEVRVAYTWLASRVRDQGADLIIITPPPVRDDLIDPGLDRQIAIARELTSADPARVSLLDATALWGDRLDLDIGDDGAPDRKPDGVHVCPQGAARFAAWLAMQFEARYAGLAPTDGTWLTGAWSLDQRYDTPVGACAAVASG